MARRSGAKSMLRNCGDGLILRRAAIADTAALIEFNCQIHVRSGPERARRSMIRWIRGMTSGAHPAMRAEDFTVVEDVNSGAIISSLCLIPQTWSYDGIEFGVGQVELVGTHPDYRRRGLIRAQMEVIHGWSRKRKHTAQAILGVPNFYRQFGYEMSLGAGGGRTADRRDVASLRKGEAEPCRVRSATETDLPFIARVERHAAQRHLVTCVRNLALWRHELQRTDRRATRIIETADHVRLGFLVHAQELWQGSINVQCYELKPGSNWLAATPSVMRYLLAIGEKYARRQNEEIAAIGFHLGFEHPLYQVAPSRLPRSHEPYAFYMRVADLPGFVRHIAPVLERRLAESIVAGYSGELKISFYRDGVRVIFDQGRLTAAETWPPGEGQSAAFPDLTFLHLLFGHHTLDELRSCHRECYASNDEARLLLSVLFPKQPSAVRPAT